MPITTLFRLFRRFNEKPLPLGTAGHAPVVQAPPVSTSTLQKERTKAIRTAAIAEYPPRDSGLPVSTIAELMDSQSELVARLKGHAAISDDLFEKRYLIPIRNLAKHTLNLPATAAGIFGGPGGLFRACLELGFLGFQAADGRIFTGMLGVEERHKQETRWRYICFCAGLMWPLGKTLEVLHVTANGQEWPARLMAFADWVEHVGADHVYLSWPRDEFELGPSVNSSAIVVNVLGPDSIRWIEAGSSKLMTALLEMTSGERTKQNAIAFDVLTRIWTKIKSREESRLPQNYGRVRFGQHMAPHLIDAIQTLINKDKWAANKWPLHANENGIYIQWPEAANDLIATLKDNKVQNIPVTVEGFMSLLMDENLISVTQTGGTFVEVTTEDGEILNCIKFKNPNGILGDYNPDDYKTSKKVKKQAKPETDQTDLFSTEKTTKEEAVSTPEATGSTEETSKAESSNAVVETDEEPEEVNSGDVRLIPPDMGDDPLGATLGLEVTTDTEKPDSVSHNENTAAVQTAEIANDEPSRIVISRSEEKEEGTEEVVKKPRKNKPQVEKTKAASSETVNDDKTPEAAASPKTAETLNSVPHYAEEFKKDRNSAKGENTIFHDVLPQHVIRSIGSRMACEHLARLMVKINEQGKDKLIFHENYVGVPWEFFEGVVTSPVEFLNKLAEAGFLYFDPDARGRKTHDIQVAPGSPKKIKAFLLSTVLTNRIGLTKE